MPPANPFALCLVVLLAGCGERAQPVTQPPETAVAPNASVAAPAPSASAEPAAAALRLPARFTALGTEPFWAAKVVGARLTYITPEDQVGRPIAVARTGRGDSVEFATTLAGKRLTLTVTAGPCSDGMSDTVYPFAVRRRLGDDEQPGCARPG